jgi:hypothetical protein
VVGLTGFDGGELIGSTDGVGGAGDDGAAGEVVVEGAGAAAG